VFAYRYHAALVFESTTLQIYLFLGAGPGDPYTGELDSPPGKHELMGPENISVRIQMTAGLKSCREATAG
jgi:hypothetical protein